MKSETKKNQQLTWFKVEKGLPASSSKMYPTGDLGAEVL